MAGVGEEIEPHGHRFGAGRIGIRGAGAGIGIGYVLAVHRGVPQAAAQAGGVHVVGTGFARPAILAREFLVHEGHAIKLVLDGADLIVGRPIGGEVHPAIVQQRGRGDARAAGSRMPVGVGLLHGHADLLEQRAAVRFVLELRGGLPGDVHGGIARHQVVRETPPLIGAGEGPGQRGRARGKDQVRQKPFAVEIAYAAVEPLKVSRIGRIGSGKGGLGFFAQNQASQMVEFLGGAGLGHGAEAGLVERGEAHLGGAHPQVRHVQAARVALGVSPMVQVGGADEAGRFRCRRGECAGLLVPFGDVADDVVIPIAGLDGGETHHHAAAAIPVARHGEGAMARRAEFHPQIDAHVGRGMRGRVLLAQFEDQIAGSVDRRIGARRCRRRRLRPHGPGRKRGEQEGQSCAHAPSVLSTPIRNYLED